MNCFYCKGDMVPDFTTHVAELENCIVIIKHVPCLKCSQCGELKAPHKVCANCGYYKGKEVIKMEAE